jgi:hypothetical protein
MCFFLMYVSISKKTHQSRVTYVIMINFNKFILFFIICIILLLSCSSQNKESVEINGNQINNSIDDINEYKPILKRFLIENQLLNENDSLVKGIKTFFKDVVKKESLKEYKPIAISKAECERFKEKKIYESVWIIDTSAIRSESLFDSENVKFIYSYAPCFNLDSEYYHWLKANEESFQLAIKDLIFLRQAILNYDSLRMVQYLGKQESIDYSDENLAAIIIVEVLFHILHNDCNHSK